MKYNLVYPLKNTEHNGALIYSLRSIDKYFEDAANIIILSDERPPQLNKNKYEWVQIGPYMETLYWAGENLENFLWMNDDIFLWGYVDFLFFENVKRGKDLKDSYKELLRNKNRWQRRRGMCVKYLLELGLPTYDYSSHRPYFFNGRKLKSVMRGGNFGYKTPVEILYYNTYPHKINPIDDHIECLYNISDERLKQARTVNINGGEQRWDESLPLLASAFPHKSCWEL